MLVVLMILALFALIALPRFAATLLRSRLDAAVDAVRGDLHFTRARAIATGRRHQFVLDQNARELIVQPYQPERENASGVSIQQPDIPLRDRLPEEVKVVEWTVAPIGYEQNEQGAGGGQDLPLVFYPEGNSDGAMLILEDGQGTRRGLRVEPMTGEVRDMTPEELRQ